MGNPVFNSGRALLDRVALVDNCVVYKATGKPVEIRYRKYDGKDRPFFFMRNRYIRPDQLAKAIADDDPSLLDTVFTRAPRGLTERDLEMLELMKTGETYDAIGKRYNLSRQRVKQVADKLAKYGHPITPIAVRMQRLQEGYQQKLVTKYGDKHADITQNPELFANLKQRLTTKRNNAARRGVEFSLTVSDLYPLPTHCPALGIPINYETSGYDDCALSIDRIDSAKGYIPGNITLVSQRANRIKNDATVEELEKIAAYYKGLTLQKPEN